MNPRILKSLVSGVIGLFIGAAVALVVDNALLEISLSRLFSVLFGFSLLLLGGVILWRVISSEEHGSEKIRKITLAFASVVIVSGLLCFVVEKQFFSSLHSGIKVPFYTVIGTSLCFSITFSLVELINQGVFTCSCFSSGYENTAPVVGTPSQIYLVLGASLLMGSLFGLVFGALDVEDDNRAHTRLANDHDWTVPLGAIVGGVVAFANEWMRNTQVYAFDALSNRSEGI